MSHSIDQGIHSNALNCICAIVGHNRLGELCAAHPGHFAFQAIGDVGGHGVSKQGWLLRDHAQLRPEPVGIQLLNVHPISQHLIAQKDYLRAQLSSIFCEPISPENSPTVSMDGTYGQAVLDSAHLEGPGASWSPTNLPCTAEPTSQGARRHMTRSTVFLIYPLNDRYRNVAVSAQLQHFSSDLHWQKASKLGSDLQMASHAAKVLLTGLCDCFFVCSSTHRYCRHVKELARTCPLVGS